jgi:hypothetical protein
MPLPYFKSFNADEFSEIACQLSVQRELISRPIPKNSATFAKSAALVKVALRLCCCQMYNVESKGLDSSFVDLRQSQNNAKSALR